MGLGCGVTAWSKADAIDLCNQAQERLLGSDRLASVHEIRENIDVSCLDLIHIRVNMGDVTIRGVWYPRS
jgi:hypothetical protein